MTIHGLETSTSRVINSLTAPCIKLSSDVFHYCYILSSREQDEATALVVIDEPLNQ